MNPRFAFLFVFLLVAGCATTDDPTATVTAGATPTAASAAFRAADFGWSTTAGRAGIDGRLTYGSPRVPYGCVAGGVVLTPETPWVRSRMSILYDSVETAALPADEVRRRTPPERSQDYSGFVKRAPCDAAGKFSFTGLADGAWFVITVARPKDPAAGKEMALMKRVVVRAGRVLKVQL